VQQQYQHQQQEDRHHHQHQNYHHHHRSIYRGVSYDPISMLWRARIYCLGKHVTLGRYTTAQEAAFVHDRAAHFIHGDDAQTNNGIEAARESNQRQPPTASWRVMNTLEMLARESQLRKLLGLSSGNATTGAARAAAAAAATAASGAQQQPAAPRMTWAMASHHAWAQVMPLPPPLVSPSAGTPVRRRQNAPGSRAQQQRQQRQQQKSTKLLVAIARRLV
jgi:hypothetical protein